MATLSSATEAAKEGAAALEADAARVQSPLVAAWTMFVAWLVAVWAAVVAAVRRVGGGGGAAPTAA